MKRALKDKAWIFILIVLFLASCGDKKHVAGEESHRYTCPMHPQIVTTEPGICPICKMDLVPISGHGQVSASDSLKYLVKPTDELVLASITTVKPQAGKRFGSDTIRGVINYNTNNWKSISSRVSGRIERLYVKYNYQAVSKGQKIMDIYSPDLANAQQELLFLKENGEPALLESAKRKLRLLGMSDGQISTTLRTGKVDYTVSIYSPYAGYLAERASSQNISTLSSAGGTMITSEDDMSGNASASVNAAPGSSASLPAVNSTSALSTREGAYVSAGQKLFDLVDASSVWAEFFLRPEQMELIRRGTEIEVTGSEDTSQKTRTRVSLVQPYYNEGSNFTVARAPLSNHQHSWPVGQIVNVIKASDGVDGIWIPRKAVVQLGSRFVLFVRMEGGFVPVWVTVAKRMGDWVDIRNSVSRDSEIAANAWFLVDSESFIKADSLKQ
ncbi:efflux RND transporter periplasmic adaptor subunit [Flavihumibacter sp. R14]|nr:efflux RND transporter periplasmic adaptor subunit [Flavihumibacter soli]